MPLGVVPGQQRDGTAPHIADPDVIIAVNVQAPRDIVASPVKPIGAGWVPSGRIILTAPVVRGGGPSHT